MSAPGESSSDDDDFQFESSHVGSKRYPVHDCCEFEDAESLRVRRRGCFYALCCKLRACSILWPHFAFLYALDGYFVDFICIVFTKGLHVCLIIYRD